MDHRLSHSQEPMRQAIDDCWNEIGVRGDGSCPHLQTHIHCRNCPVHSAAARALLDAPVSADLLSDSTRHFAVEQELVEGDTHSALVFRVGLEWLAIATSACIEVTSVRPIHSLPHRRGGAVLGVANVRGELLVCVSLAAIFGLTLKPETESAKRGAAQQRLLVVGQNGPIALPVDEVHGVYRFRSRELTSVPDTVAKAQATYTRGLLPLEGKSIGLLDEQLLFYTLERSLS